MKLKNFYYEWKWIKIPLWKTKIYNEWKFYKGKIITIKKRPNWQIKIKTKSE